MLWNLRVTGYSHYAFFFLISGAKSTSNFSFSHNVFHSYISLVLQNAVLCGNCLIMDLYSPFDNRQSGYKNKLSEIDLDQQLHAFIFFPLFLKATAKTVCISRYSTGLEDRRSRYRSPALPIFFLRINDCH